MEATLQRIWGQCLGLPDVQRNANFFELGGDSLVAISVAMTASNKGLTSPAGSLREPDGCRVGQGADSPLCGHGLPGGAGDVTHPPAPNISYFNGVRGMSGGVPLILQLRPVQVDDVCAVLTSCATTMRPCVCDSSNVRHVGAGDRRR
jgi:phthiocerol/phenolphthiocerol synthesis type-I polyketide synthase E